MVVMSGGHYEYRGRYEMRVQPISRGRNIGESHLLCLSVKVPLKIKFSVPFSFSPSFPLYLSYL